MGILLLLPFFLIRFGLLSLLDKSAIQRAAHFAPMEGRERTAYWLYQLSNIAIVIYLFFLRVKFTPALPFYAGAILYLLANLLLILSVVNFATPARDGLNRQGLYRFSRNPMYVAYFLYFLACSLLTQSALLFAFVLLFQLSAHWIILAEERWCENNFGEAYRQYKRQVRRYL